MAWTSVVAPSLAPSVSVVARAVPAAAPDHADTHDGDVVYRLEASCALPRVDCVTTIKTLVLRNPRHLARFDRLAHRGRRAINASLALGCMTTWAWLATDAATGRALAVVTYACFFAPLVMGFLSMRVDLIKLLVRTYEFWYIALNSALSAALLCVYLQDAARALLPPMTFVWYVRASLVDANCSAPRATALVLTTGAVSVAVFMVGVVLELMPATRAVVLLEVNGHVLGAEDVALNGLGIVLLLLARNAYRKFATAPPRRTSAGDVSARVRLIGYRTRIRFVECSSVAATPSGRDGSASRSASVEFAAGGDKDGHTTSQLVCAAPLAKFFARRVVWPAAFDALPARSYAGRLPVWALSRGAVAVGVLAVALPFTPALLVATAVSTALYGAMSLALCNRAMLKLLAMSFDVQFLFAQHLMAHLTAAYLLRWDARSLLTLTSWLWLVWLLAIDALTPAAKRRLCISRRFLVFVFAKLLLEQLTFVGAFTSLPFENRTLLTVRVSSHRRVEVKAIPFFLTRLLSMFWWTGRLLWRVVRQDASELVVIQGSVDFEDLELRRKLLKKRERERQDTHTQHVTVAPSKPPTPTPT